MIGNGDAQNTILTNDQSQKQLNWGARTMSRDHRKTPPRYNQQFFRDWGGAGPLTIGLVAIWCWW